MTYRDRLHYWCIICCLSDATTRIVARFRRRGDAEAHLRILKRLNPTMIYEIVFNCEPNRFGD